MDLKKVLPKKEKKKEAELFWSVVIEPGWVQAGIWKVENDEANIIASSLPSAWELEDELISTTDAALSSAVQNLQDVETEPSNTVFGVVSSWVKDGEIKDQYLARIKKICTKLSLTPVGFVIIPEAVAHLIKAKEGAPLSSVVLGVSKENIEMSVFRLGNLVGTSEIARSVSAFDDVAEGLTRFADGDFPTRFILYDGKEGELEDFRQALLKANWDDLEKIKFLHTPKIEILTPDEKMQAVSLAGASELGNVKGIKISGGKQELDSEESVREKIEAENVGLPEKKLSAEDLGFAIGSDISEISPKEVSEKTQPQPQEEERTPEVKSEVKPTEEKHQVAVKVDSKKKNPLALFSRFKPKKSKLPMTRKFKTKLGSIFARKTLLIGVVFLVLIFASAVAAWWFLPKAQVTVYLTTKRLDERVSITVDSEAESASFSDVVTISGNTVSTQVTGDDTVSTTGTKIVGEKAKGEVVLYRVGPTITLESGTEIKGPSGLTFSLDEKTTLASGSAGSAGITKASVTAVDLGAQYNLAGSSTFSVSNYSSSDMEAKSESAFAGGSSREINAVSEEDQESLEEALKEELLEKAKEELISGLENDSFFIKDSLSSTINDSDFNHKVGDEAETLALSMTLEVSALVVDKSALTEIAKETLKDRVPDGFVLRSEQINMEFEVEDEDDGKYELTAFVEANLLPEVDPEGLAQKIRGKYPSLAEKYLTTEVPGFVRAEISLKPRLPGRLGTLPHVLKNIEVEIAAER